MLSAVLVDPAPVGQTSYGLSQLQFLSRITAPQPEGRLRPGLHERFGNLDVTVTES